MTDKKPSGVQLQTIPQFAPYVQESFDLARMDAFVKSLGATFYHWKALPSPIGLSDRGDYRRNEGVDIITSNGYVYTFGGKFTATMTGNQKDQVRPNEGGLYDSSTAYLVMPRFYNDSTDEPVGSNNPDTLPVQGCEDDCGPKKEPKRIYLTPGDRLYHDPSVNTLVVNKELITFSYNSVDVPMYPIVKIDGPIVDSLGKMYTAGKDFKINKDGNIAWIGNGPGIDPDTGIGRTYSVRYLYHSFYYVTRILREVRITEVTEDSVRRPERMAYYVEVMREFLYHNINRGSDTNKPANHAVEKRQTPEVPGNININSPQVLVEMTDLDDNE